MIRKFVVGLLILAGVFSCAHPIFAQDPPQRPTLFLSEDDFKRIRQLADTEPWAKKQKEEILKNASAFPQSYESQFGLHSAEFPPEGGQWGHYYACPKTGRLLVFHPPDQHVCPDDGQVFKGYPYDQVVYTQRADALGAATVNLALAFRLSENHRYAEEAANLLKAYADRYLSYPLHDNNGKTTSTGARVYSQTLDESIWLIQMAWAYDLLRGTDVLTADDRRHIEQDFLRPAASVVGRAEAITYNWTAWDNAAVAAVGYTLHDQKLIDQALDGSYGFRFQIKAFVIDGFWIEGTWGYQFYVMRALSQLAEMAEHNGTNLWQEQPNLKALYSSPFGVMFPDGTLPPFSDSRLINIYDQAPLYEVAYKVFRDPLFASVITHGDHPRPEAAGLPFGGAIPAGVRDNSNALFFGAATVPHEKVPPLKSTVFPTAGYATLRAPTGDLTEVMKFGPHGAGHGHYDKLSGVIYANGGLMSVDPGTQFYGVASHNTWDRSTVAHNTVVVDEKSQAESTGKLVSWQTDPDFTSVEADAGPVYAGITMQRRIVLTSRYILEITNVAATDGADHTFDWVYHNFGQQHLQLPTQPWSGFHQENGYQHLSQNQTAATTNSWQDIFHIAASADQPARGMHLWMLGGVDTDLFSGMGLGPDLRVPVPYVMARRRGRAAEYAVLLEPFRESASITSFHSISHNVYSVQGSGWTDTITLGEKVSLQHRQPH